VPIPAIHSIAGGGQEPLSISVDVDALQSRLLAMRQWEKMQLIGDMQLGGSTTAQSPAAIANAGWRRHNLKKSVCLTFNFCMRVHIYSTEYRGEHAQGEANRGGRCEDAWR